MHYRLSYFIALLGLAGFAEAEPMKQMLVYGSNVRPFGFICRVAGQPEPTYYVNHDNPKNDYRVATNIVFTDLSGGKIAISFSHGDSYYSSSISATYLVAVGESCEAFEQK